MCETSLLGVDIHLHSVNFVLFLSPTFAATALLFLCFIGFTTCKRPIGPWLVY